MTNPETAAQSATEKDTLPERYRDPRFTTFDDVMQPEWIGAAGEWLHSQRGYFTRGGDEGHGRFNYELLEVDELYKPTTELKAAIVERLTDAIEQVGIPDFDLEYIECHATLYHHGSHFTWHTDREGYNGQPAHTRRLSYCLYLHSMPKMFNGGELEFLDGTTVDPQNNRLVLFCPYQQHRVRHVECWSAEFLHARWAIFGWIHGQPKGSTEHLEGKPLSG